MMTSMIAAVGDGSGNECYKYIDADDSGNIGTIPSAWQGHEYVVIYSWLQPDIRVSVARSSVIRLIHPESDEGVRIRAADGRRIPKMPDERYKNVHYFVLRDVVENWMVHSRASIPELRAMIGYSSEACRARIEAEKKYINKTEVEAMCDLISWLP